MDKIRKVQGESGAVVILFLVLFFVMALFFFSMYQLAASDYIQSSKAIEGKNTSLEANNIVESVLGNYKTDMMNDISYDDSKEELSKDKHWQQEYRNFSYQLSGTDFNSQSAIKNLVSFKYYTPLAESDAPKSSEATAEDEYFVATDSRLYKLSDNWKTTNDSTVKDTNDFYNGESLNTRNGFYVLVKFADDVENVRLAYGNSDRTVEKVFTIRKNSKKNNVYLVPVSDTDTNTNSLVTPDVTTSTNKVNPVFFIDQFILETNDGELGNTTFSVLTQREVDVMVYEENAIPNATNKKLRDKNVIVTQKTLRVSQGKLSNQLSFVDDEVFEK